MSATLPDVLIKYGTLTFPHRMFSVINCIVSQRVYFAGYITLYNLMGAVSANLKTVVFVTN